MVQVKSYANIDSFFQDTLSFLEQNEAANNLHIGIPLSMPRLRAFDNPLNLFAVFKNQKVVFVCLQTPPRNLLISGEESLSEEIFKVFIPFLFEKNIKASGIIGPKNISLALAEAWKLQTGQNWEINFQQLIYQLDQLKPVPLSSGKFRQANLEDLPIVQEWLIDFVKDAMNTSDPEKTKAIAKAKTEEGSIYLWEDGAIVSMASVARPTRNGITVNYVYTPPAYRGKGYASSCVSKMSELMLKKYQFCCLFTDMSNSTSNKIYKNMGYYPITEYRDIKFIDSLKTPS